MSKTRGIIYAVLVCAGLTVLWFQRRSHDKAVNAQIHSTVLPTNDQAKVIIDPLHHSITTVTRGTDGKSETKSTFLTRTGASVELRKDGSVVVTAPKWGTEIDPFVGGAFGSDVHGRAALGLNVIYIQRWELGTGLVFNSNIHDTRLFMHVSYNFYSNYYVAAGIDNHKTAQVMAGWKF